MIEFRKLTLRRGSDALLEHADARIMAGHKVGLVGANGCGKSSLFALLLGQLQVDTGEWSIPAQWRVAHMAQSFHDLGRSAMDFVLDGDAAFRAAEAAIATAEATGDGEALAHAYSDFEHAQGYSAPARAGALLNGLGFAPTEHARSLGEFSGGWRVRLGLAQALMAPSDLLLLDEPTNHLDLETVLWLEDWLKAYAGTLLLISHDRDFLDGVVDHIVHMEGRSLHSYSGDYSDFERQRSEALALQQASFAKQQREIQHMHRFVERFRYKASKAKAAQSRLKALERMERIAPAHVDSPFTFEFRPPRRASHPLLQLEEADFGYGDTMVLKGVNLTLAPGDRLGLLGANGAGKSTLVRAMAGELAPLRGRRVGGGKLSVGYFAQHQLEQLDPQASPLLHLQRVAPAETEQALRDFLGGFGFQGDMALRASAPFSGGEKARLVLAILVWQSPNLLLLDEPTNHLDLEMRLALTRALQGFDGAVVTVSHDRHLLTATVDRYVLVREGGVRPFDGDLGDYRRWLAQPMEQGPAKSPPAAVDAKTARRAAAARREQMRPLRAKAESLLKEVERLTTSLSELETQLSDATLYEGREQERLNELLQQQGRLRKELETREQDWLDAEQRLEDAGET